jgi:hypothetical protein
VREITQDASTPSTQSTLEKKKKKNWDSNEIIAPDTKYNYTNFNFPSPPIIDSFLPAGVSTRKKKITQASIVEASQWTLMRITEHLY